MFTLVLSSLDEFNKVKKYITETFNFKNITIQYENNNIIFIFKDFEKSCNDFSIWISNLIITLFEKKFINKLIRKNYFYFEPREQAKVSDISSSIINEDIKNKNKLVFLSVYDYIKNNALMILDGFALFRLHDYIEVLDYLVDLSANNYIINREYEKFISLLKEYIKNEPSKIDIIHLLYLNQEALLLTQSKSIIPINDNILDAKYLSDISFSNNDYVLNTILNLLPKKLYLHVSDDEDEFLLTLKKIFQDRIIICYNCDICNFYRNNISTKK